MTDGAPLTAFLALWLCHHLVSSGRVWYIWPATFLVAAYLVREEALSLALVVLTCIYQDVRILSSSSTLSLNVVVFSTHFLSCWLGLYFEGMYTQVTSDEATRHLPLMCQFADTVIGSPTDFSAHLVIRMMKKSPLCFIKHPVVRGLPIEDLACVDDPEQLLEDLHQDFLISIRTGLLSLHLRSKNRYGPYSPYRVANQFGFDKDGPSYSLESKVWKRGVC